MSKIRTLLCPVDFSPLCRHEIALAGALARAFGAKLVLHHNLDAASPGLTMGWMWNQVHAGEQPPEVSAEEGLKRLLAELPPDVEGEARLSNGPVAQSVLFLQQQLPADLMVIGTHGASSEEHTSVTERLIGQSLCPVLVVHEADCAAAAERLAEALAGKVLQVLVPTDGLPAARRATAFAFALARFFPLELHLMQVLETGQVDEAESDIARSRLQSSVPEELKDRVYCEVVNGDPEPAILAAISRREVAWVVMGTHARGFFRRYFTRDVAQAMLHRATCPVWFVPEGWVAT